MNIPIDQDMLVKLIEDPLVFAESLLVEPFTQQPFRANHVQRIVLSAVRDHDRVAVRVSRQTGKTYGMTVICLWGALRAPNQSVLVVAPDKSKVKTIIDNIDRFLDSNPILARSIVARHGSPYYERKFSNGSRIAGFTLGSRTKRHGESVRSQSADMVVIDEAAYVADEDWRAVNPIIEGGLYRPKTKAVVASTPALASGRFYEIFHNSSLDSVWHRIHVPITENPDFADRVDQIRASCPNDLEWITEFLAEFPDSGVGVFRQSDVHRALAEFVYNFRRARYEVAMGVDWDKYEAGVNIAVVQFNRESGVYELIYREEVQRTEMVLTEAVRRIVELTDLIPNVRAVYVDRGYGDMQLEMLHQEGYRRPSTGLDKKVVGWSFNQKVDVRDPVTGEMVKKRLKDAMISLFQHILEEHRFQFPKTDHQLYRQLLGYHVVSLTQSGPRYNKEGDHVIDAICLALWALRDLEPVFRQAPVGQPMLLPITSSSDGGLHIRPPSSSSSPISLPLMEEKGQMVRRSFAIPGMRSRSFGSGGSRRVF